MNTDDLTDKQLLELDSMVKETLRRRGVKPSSINVTDECTEMPNKIIRNLFEAFSLEISILKYPPNKSLLSNGHQANSADDGKVPYSITTQFIGEGPCIAFLRYIAQLDFYQHSMMEHDLQDFRFKEIYQEFTETGIMSETDTHYCKQRIDAALHEHHGQFRQWIEKSGNPLLLIDEEPTEDCLIGGRARTVNLDAWGVSNSVLHAYCLTSQTTFGNKAAQAVMLGEGILNSIKAGKLKGISDFHITTACSTIFYKDRDNTHPLNEELKNLLGEGNITLLDYNAMKYVQVDKEILHIIVNTPEPLYNQLKGRLTFGFHSDKSVSVLLKDFETQTIMSTERLRKATSLIASLIINLETSNGKEKMIGQWLNAMDQSFGLAHSAAILHFPGNEDLQDLLDNVEANLSNARDTLVRANSPYADNISLATSRHA